MEWMTARVPSVSSARMRVDVLQCVDRGAKGGNQRHAFGTRAQSSLLPAAQKLGQDACAAAQIESANPLRSMDFMPADGNEVSSERAGAEFQFAKSLHRVAVQ